MIHVIDELHLNDFKEVRCPKGRDLFKKVIKSAPNDSFVGSEEPISMFGDKVSQLEDLYAYDAWQQSRENAENSDAVHDSSSEGPEHSGGPEEDEK